MDKGLDDPAYKITPLGVLSLHVGPETAVRAFAALKDRASRYAEGMPAIIFEGVGGSFISIQESGPEPKP